MDEQPLFLDDLADFLRVALDTDRYPTSEQGGVYRSANRPVRRIGLALEPTAETGNRVRNQQLDALWLHRPWQLNPAALPPDVGILYHHLPFDERLTTGYNIRLAQVLGLEPLAELGHKQIVGEPGTLPVTDTTRPLGMIGRFTGDGAERTCDDWLALINHEFGGYDRVHLAGPRTRSCECVAVVGAMNPVLIHEAHERGVDLYLTGEYRKGTQQAVDETGISVTAIGHRRTEEWGLRALGTLLRQRWDGLGVLVIS